MQLKVGDRVKFLNDTGGGTVTKVLNRDMVQVLNEDGFEVPILTEELIKTEAEQPEEEVYSQQQEEEMEEQGYDAFEEEVPDSESLSSAGDPGNHLYFAFVPMDTTHPGNGDLESYLVNDSDFYIFYLILLKRDNAWVYFASGNLEDNMKTFIKTIEQERFNEIGHFRFQFIFYQKGFFQPYSPLEMDLNVHPRKFFKSTAYTQNDFFEEPAMVMELKQEEALSRKLSSLSSEEIARAVEEKEGGGKSKPSRARPSKPDDTEEVDLHIEELVDKPKELSNQQMLDIQMSRFQTALEGARKTPKTKKIVFIHGVGNGRLRYEIRKHLDRYYPNLDYQDASFKEYGYGATLVFVGK